MKTGMKVGLYQRKISIDIILTIDQQNGNLVSIVTNLQFKLLLYVFFL